MTYYVIGFAHLVLTLVIGSFLLPVLMMTGILGQLLVIDIVTGLFPYVIGLYFATYILRSSLPAPSDVSKFIVGGALPLAVFMIIGASAISQVPTNDIPQSEMLLFGLLFAGLFTAGYSLGAYILIRVFTKIPQSNT